ncbi:hypothetical protein PS880_05625 [Pseudomonas fluorescens]|uniref:Uncharacterized protein n=1 Tax=Pseudomonas fluorescens TaxID=294 RepID=A0A5E7Q0C9_PSEFL|nr:hypothetical protein PS880_05625 [Pseudomonas fluorescens]
MVKVQAFDRHQVQFFGHGHRFCFLHQGDNQVIGQALP